MRQNNEAHWDKVYTRNTDQQVGWYQPRPVTSLRLIEKYAQRKDAFIIDIGAGNSHLATELINSGFQHIFLLDISTRALERAREKLETYASLVSMIKGSVLDFEINETFDIWHDRAVFHFFHQPHEINAYKNQVIKYLNPGGIFILATFSLNGPEMCSGLPVNRQSTESIENLFGDAFQILESFTEDHITPANKIQNYLFSVLKKKN